MNRISRPKVFLSHSAKDKLFIKMLSDNLQKAKIDFWLDEYEIRDGKPWMKMIFEDGLPSCQAIIVYFTDNSIDSKMVQKEIDSALLQELENNSIAFLPYVEHAALRNKLRVDIRTLHCRELNPQNFADLFPSIVSEIWLSYLEQIVDEIRIREKVKRQEIENSYMKLKERTKDTPFSRSQNKDFKYLYDKLNTVTNFTVSILDDKSTFYDAVESTFNGSLNFLDLFIHLLRSNSIRFNEISIRYFIEQIIKDNYTFGDNKSIRINIDDSFKLVELRSYGLIDDVVYDKRSYTSKAFKFNYWLGFNKLIGDELNIIVEE